MADMRLNKDEMKTSIEDRPMRTLDEFKVDLDKMIREGNEIACRRIDKWIIEDLERNG